MDDNLNPEVAKKTREIELLEQLVEETKKSGEFTERFSYVMFCFTVIGLVVAVSALFFSVKTAEINEIEKFGLIILFGAGIAGLFFVMMRKPGWRE